MLCPGRSSIRLCLSARLDLCQKGPQTDTHPVLLLLILKKQEGKKTFLFKLAPVPCNYFATECFFSVTPPQTRKKTLIYFYTPFLSLATTAALIKLYSKHVKKNVKNSKIVQEKISQSELGLFSVSQWYQVNCRLGSDTHLWHFYLTLNQLFDFIFFISRFCYRCGSNFMWVTPNIFKGFPD